MRRGESKKRARAFVHISNNKQVEERWNHRSDCTAAITATALIVKSEHNNEHTKDDHRTMTVPE